MKNLCLNIIEYTNQAMLYELFTYPSFGLVSPHSSGSHQDMNAFNFIDSISVLNKYMFQFAELGFNSGKITSMYNDAVEIGISCEKAMFKKTSGINTHKGLIFVLGTLVVSSVKALYDNDSFETIFENCKHLVYRKRDEIYQLNAANKLSNGEKIFLQYQIEGVRKEAYSGFPIIQKALKYIDLNNKDSLVETLVFIMSLCDDTTIINRKKMKRLDTVKKEMSEIVSLGFPKDLINSTSQRYELEGISPGGSADLLCGTVFLSLIKNKFLKRSE